MDFITGVATAITPMAFFETVMIKGYETLGRSRHQSWLREHRGHDRRRSAASADRLRAGKTSMADILFKTEIASSTPSTTRCRPSCGKLNSGNKIGGPMAADTPIDEFDECDGAEDMYDPGR